MTDPHRESDSKPRGSAGLVNGAAKTTVPEVGVDYADAIHAAREAALAKREADVVALHGDLGENYPHHIPGYGD